MVQAPPQTDPQRLSAAMCIAAALISPPIRVDARKRNPKERAGSKAAGGGASRAGGGGGSGGGGGAGGGGGGGGGGVAAHLPFAPDKLDRVLEKVRRHFARTCWALPKPRSFPHRGAPLPLVGGQGPRAAADRQLHRWAAQLPLCGQHPQQVQAPALPRPPLRRMHRPALRLLPRRKPGAHPATPREGGGAFSL